MEFEVTEHIAAPRSAIEEALTNDDYYASLEGTLGNLDRPALLLAERSETRICTDVRYAFTGAVSGAVRMAVNPDKLTWVIRTEIDLRTHIGTFVVIPDHYQGLLSCAGRLTFTEESHSTTETVTGSLQVNVPFVGSSAERTILEAFSRHLGSEAEALSAFCGLL